MNKINTSITMALALIALVVALFAISSKGTTSTVTADDTFSKAISSGKINVCYGVYPPTVIKDSKTGALSGVTIDLINGIFKQANITPSYVEVAYGDQPSAIAAKRCDMAAELNAQVARAALVDFSDPMYYLGDQVLGKKGESRFTSLFDLDKSSVTIAVMNGETGHNFVKANLTNAKLNVIDAGTDLSRIAAEVTAGRADVAITDAGTIKAYAAVHPETSILFDNGTFGTSLTSFAVRQSDKSLLQFLNTALAASKADGTYSKIAQKYDASFLLTDQKALSSAY